jgi:hypothetical protein
VHSRYSRSGRGQRVLNDYHARQRFVESVNCLPRTTTNSNDLSLHLGISTPQGLLDAPTYVAAYSSTAVESCCAACQFWSVQRPAPPHKPSESVPFREREYLSTANLPLIIKNNLHSFFRTLIFASRSLQLFILLILSILFLSKLAWPLWIEIIP